jgi:predicted acetyltransferase
VKSWCTVATTKNAVTAILSIFGSYGSIAPTVSFFGSPTHTLLSGLEERHHKIDLSWYPMTRTLDAGRALAARSYPRSASCDLSFAVTRAPKTGLVEREVVRLAVSGGRAQVTAAESQRVSMTEHAFTQMFTGFRSAAELFALGEITIAGPDAHADVEVLDDLFRGPTPSLPDFF